MSAPITYLRTFNAAAILATHEALATASRADRDELLEAYEQRWRLRKMKDRLALLEGDLIPTAEDARFYGWLGALEEERLELEAEIRRLEHVGTERDEYGALRMRQP